MKLCCTIPSLNNTIYIFLLINDFEVVQNVIPNGPSIIRLLIKRCFFPVIIDFRVL